MHPEKKNGNHQPPKRHERKDDGNAFIRDPGSGPAHSSDVTAEELAEEYLTSATSGEEQGEDALNAVAEEELGGPFVMSSPETEIAAEEDPDLADAPREPEPTAMRSRRS